MKNAAVTKMKVELGEQTVYGIVKEKEEAKQEFDEGVKQGKTMAYSEEDLRFSQIKRLKIGQLAPNKQLKVIFEYIQSLEVFLNKLIKIIKATERKFQLDLKRFQNTQMAYLTSETLHFTINKILRQYQILDHLLLIGNLQLIVYISSQITGKLQQIISQTRRYNQFLFNFLFLQSSLECFKNLSSNIKHTNNDALLIQKYCATLTFIPQFNQISLDDPYKYIESITLPQKQVINRGNYLFIIDRSGSMDGSKIEKAKKSLILFLKILPQNSLFNNISFGNNNTDSKYLSLWNESMQYAQDTLQEAIQHVENMTADFGGTNIYKPFKEKIYNSSYRNSNNTTLNLFLLKDGKDDADPIIQLVKDNNRAETRIYTLGIGEG
ncbi:unnamed protein product [Paramecium sonneborni]|uniref:VWFA domain-containing protein n=1 Tax=Paramecium sonneborni TaxID=65129 RepID=A0A8S1R2U4_9CILI|nr:unnamed protein product [Paramecium sonneborni]